MHWGTREMRNEPTLSSNKRTRSQSNSNKMGFLKDPVGSWTGMLKLHLGLKKKKKRGGAGNFIEGRVTKAAFLAQAALDPRDGIQGNDDSHSSPGIFSWLLLERAYRLNIQLQQGRARVCLPQGMYCNVAWLHLCFQCTASQSKSLKTRLITPGFVWKQSNSV